MINQFKSSAILLLFLGMLFSIPIVAKTLSTHGAIPALFTALLIIVSVFMGPLSFVVASSIETEFIFSGLIRTDLEVILVLVVGVVLVIAWAKAIVRGPGISAAYLPVTGWALTGAYFCVLQVFTHIT